MGAIAVFILGIILSFIITPIAFLICTPLAIILAITRGGNKAKETKTCGDCAEEILINAKVCKHCGKKQPEETPTQTGKQTEWYPTDPH